MALSIGPGTAASKIGHSVAVTNIACVMASVVRDFALPSIMITAIPSSA
jgi:hypothetical protein